MYSHTHTYIHHTIYLAWWKAVLFFFLLEVIKYTFYLLKGFIHFFVKRPYFQLIIIIVQVTVHKHFIPYMARCISGTKTMSSPIKCPTISCTLLDYILLGIFGLGTQILSITIVMIWSVSSTLSLLQIRSRKNKHN